MIAGSQTRGHEAVDHNQVRLNISNNVDSRGKEVDHLASSIRHVDCSSIFNSLTGVAKTRRLDKRQREACAVLLASEVVFNRLHQGQAVDLVIDSTCGNIILEARRSG